MLLLSPTRSALTVADAVTGTSMQVEADGAAAVRERSATPDRILAELRLMNLYLAALSGLAVTVADLPGSA
jgi:hypothetical protein